MLKRLKRKEEDNKKEDDNLPIRIGHMLSRLSLEESKKSPNRLKVPWKRRVRNSEDSAQSSNSGASIKNHSRGHTPTSSIGGMQGAWTTITQPFPLIRSHSSISGVVEQPASEQRGRSLTEGEPPLELAFNPTPPQVEDPPLPPYDENSDVIAYLSQLGTQNRGGRLCLNLAQHNSPFLANVMHAYVSSQFSFMNEPIDIALRKFLLVAKLPLETQQTERVLECFSRVYHEQNPWVFVDDQQAYFVVFSIVILHTDFFNKNVKHKMAKEDYVRSAYCEDIPIEFFEYIYDNTTCAQFIHGEDTDTRRSTPTPSATPALEATDAVVSRRSTSFGWRSDLIVDPYTSIFENNTSTLRPNLGSVVATTDPFVPCFVETPKQLLSLRERFQNGPTVQLVSQRSRPDAWQANVEDRARLSTENLLQITTPGIVEIKVVKIGILLRREASKRVLYQKSSWREWGALLTESQLYLFKNVAWVKSMLDTQSDTIIRAPIDEFNATTTSSTKDMAAMYLANSSNEQPNQFILTGRGGSQQWFAARTEEEAVDWIHNINFAAAFSTYHVGPVPTVYKSDKLIRSASDSSISLHSPHRKMRTEALSSQLREIDRKIASIQEQVNVIERDSNNLQMLMPLQQKTKEMVMFAVGQCSSKCEYCWLDRARLRCYRNMLELDLKCEEESSSNQRPPLHVRTPEPEMMAQFAASPIRTPDNPRFDETYYVDATSSPTMSRTSRTENEGVYIAAGRQFSLVNMNPDLVNSSPLSSNPSISSLAPQRSQASVPKNS